MPLYIACKYLALSNDIIYYVGIAVRLVGGNSYNEGRVEVNYNGEWGTVCDDGWSSNDASVVCRQLGFRSYTTYYRNAYFGQGSGPVWLDYLLCTGSESTIASCGHLGFNVTRSCSHYEDAGVRCYAQGTACVPIIHIYIYIYIYI